jgi:hypothetical protein
MLFYLVCVIDEVMTLSKCFFAEGALGTVALVRVHWRIHRPEEENNRTYKYYKILNVYEMKTTDYVLKIKNLVLGLRCKSF